MSTSKNSEKAIELILNIAQGSECYLCLKSKGRAFLVEYIGWEETNSEPDFYFRHLPKSGLVPGISSYGINEIGVGFTKEEAIANYGVLTPKEFNGRILECKVTPGGFSKTN